MTAEMREYSGRCFQNASMWAMVWPGPAPNGTTATAMDVPVFHKHTNADVFSLSAWRAER